MPCTQQLLQGDRGLLFTDSPPEEVLEWFADYKQADYARTGNVVDEEFVLPEGELSNTSPGCPLPRPVIGQIYDESLTS